MDWFLIIIAAVAFVLTVVVAFYLVLLYSAPEDRFKAWLPKIVVVTALSLSAFAVLLLPFDVANKKRPEVMDDVSGGLDLPVMWQMLLWTIAAWMLLVTPFATFYYEGWDPNQTSSCSQAKPAICYTSAFFFCFLILFVILWLTVGYADLDLDSFSSPPTAWDLSSGTGTWSRDWSDTLCFCDKNMMGCAGEEKVSSSACTQKGGTLSVKVSAFIYIVGLLCALGWFSFVAFGGSGIIALPLDLINDFRTRPARISSAEYIQRRKLLQAEAMQLVSEGRDLEAKHNRRQRTFFGGGKKAVNQFGEKVTNLEERWENLNASMDVTRKVLLSYVKLPIGVIGLALSAMWVLHILLNNLIGVTPFLNNMFVSLDGFFPLFGTIAYALFSIWMLWASVKGCFKLGCNFGIISIHPMKVGDTLMSSLLFNSLLVLVTSVTVAQFCSLSFRKYAANTVVDSMFSAYVNHLRGIGVILRYFQIVFLCFSFLTLIYLVVKPCCCRKRD